MADLDLISNQLGEVQADIRELRKEIGETNKELAKLSVENAQRVTRVESRLDEQDHQMHTVHRTLADQGARLATVEGRQREDEKVLSSSDKQTARRWERLVAVAGILTAVATIALVVTGVIH